MNNQLVKHQNLYPFHLIIKLTGKRKDDLPRSSEQVAEKPQENPIKEILTSFQQEITKRKLEVDTCSITDNRVKISFIDYGKADYELDLNPITKKLVECFEKNIDQIAEIKQTVKPDEAKIEIEMSKKLNIFLMFFKDFRETLLSHSWDKTSFHWSKKNGLSTKLTVEGRREKSSSSGQNCDNFAEFIENSLEGNQYDQQHFEMTRKKCSIEIKSLTPQN